MFVIEDPAGPGSSVNPLLICAGEKLRILQALVGKLLTLASSRDLIEDCMDEQKAAKQDLREIRAEQHRREREEAAHRYTDRVHAVYTGISAAC